MSATEHPDDIQISPSYALDPQLHDGIIGIAADGMDVEKTPSEGSGGNDVRLSSSPLPPFGSLPSLPGLNGNGGYGGAAGAYQIGGGIMPSFFPPTPAAGLPPIASTSQAQFPRIDYSEEEIKAWRDAQVDAKQEEVRCGFSFPLFVV
jgi:hypothetical protein